jgi:hypothetical protein
MDLGQAKTLFFSQLTIITLQQTHLLKLAPFQ